MQIDFRLVDSSRLKRWHGKVAKAAADHLTSLTDGFSCEFPKMLAAEFSISEGNKTTICRTRVKNQVTTTVVFTVAGWDTVASSIGDAIEQLACAVLHIIPRERVPDLNRLFTEAGISTLRIVQETTRSIPHDTRAHFIIYINATHTEFSELDDLFNELDLILQRERHGEVDGSGTGVMGHQFDVALQNREAGLRSVFGFLNRHSLTENVRVEDSETGEELKIPHSGE